MSREIILEYESIYEQQSLHNERIGGRMTQIIYGDRVGKQGKIRVGCSAIIFNDEGRFLLTRRSDNGQWCLPSGGLEPGESLEETCIREVFEET